MEQNERMEYIDLEDGLKRLRGNKKLYRRMIQLFLDSPQFSALDEALAAGDIQKSADEAHAIKGMVGNLSFPRLFQSSTALMDALRGGGAPAELVEAYRADYEKTREAVEDLARELDAALSN